MRTRAQTQSSPRAPEQLRLIDDAAVWRAVDVAELRRERERLHTGNRSRRTLAEYRKDWAHFEAWCAGAGREAMPAIPETLELYLTAHAAAHKVSTLRRRIAAIAAVHRSRGVESPAGEGARLILESVEREKGSRPVQKAALTPEDLRAISRALDALGSRQALRDRALLVLGFATGLRREELAALQLEHVEFAGKGLVVRIAKSKTDQKRNGRRIGIFRGKHAATCPVRTLRSWLKARGREAGPLFVRTDRAAGELAAISGDGVNEIVKRCVEIIGLDPADYGGHSLRAGMITAAAADGVPDTAIMQRSGHKSVQTLKRYIRHTDLFAFDPLAKAL